jgi:uncharacterized protein YbjQ (UPF0145 family)
MIHPQHHQSFETILHTTTHQIENHNIEKYYGIVSGEAIIGANIFRDFFASITDIVGGRSSSYEHVFKDAKTKAILDMDFHARMLGANAIVGIDLDYETIGNGMLMVTASGTAVYYT